MTGWVELPLGELAQLIRGVSYPKIEASSTPRTGYLPILRATNIRDEGLILENDLIYVPQKYVKAEQRLQPGDIIIGMSSGSKELVGKAAQLVLSWPGACGAFCAVARCKPEVEPKFVGYFFRSNRYRQLIQAKSSGININNLRYTDLEQLPLPVPPLAEQQRIATAIEHRFARLDAGTATLRQIQAKLSRYKAAVLQAAVTGRLVPLNPADEPAADLLRHLLVKHEQAILPESHPDLPPLPEGWCWASLVAIADVLAGYAFKSAAYSASGFQIVRIGNVER